MSEFFCLFLWSNRNTTVPKKISRKHLTAIKTPCWIEWINESQKNVQVPVNNVWCLDTTKRLYSSGIKRETTHCDITKPTASQTSTIILECANSFQMSELFKPTALLSFNTVSFVINVNYIDWTVPSSSSRIHQSITDVIDIPFFTATPTVLYN